MRRHAVALAIALPTVVLALAACGGSSSSSSPAAGATSTASASGGTSLQLAAASSGALQFDRKALEAPAGMVVIDMTNASTVPHDIAIKGNGVDVVGKVVTNGGISTVTADLKPGTYTFLCTVDSHADAGMKGRLTVK
jgi:plastocyanin